MATKETDFKPFDRVLVRDTDTEFWEIAIYDKLIPDNVDYPHRVLGNMFFAQCIPYEGNEHLYGTTDSPESKRRRPTDGEIYWYVVWYGRGRHNVYSSMWDGDDVDTNLWTSRNCFLTEQDAERAAEYMDEAWKKATAGGDQ